MGNVQELWQKIKSLAEGGIAEWGLFAVILLVSLASFGLGRLSVSEGIEAPVTIREAQEASNPEVLVPGGMLVGSANGSVYYYPWCSGAQKITPSNQRLFKTAEEAQAAGYSAGRGCKGLE